MPDFEVVALPETDHVEAGETAPDFTRPLVSAESWEDRSLSDLTDDGPVLLVFYPMDGAFPATYVWNEIRDRGWPDLIETVGVSISTPYEHGTFLEERGLDCRLFSDPANGVAREYGVVNDLDGMAGVAEPRTALFLVDDDCTVEYAWAASEQPDFPDYDEAERAVERLVD
jgi:peroxiredoxin